MVRIARDLLSVPVAVLSLDEVFGRRKAAEQRMLHMASHDALTGLPNRALFQERLSQTIAEAKRNGKGFAVFCLDLDRFKQVNDALGHHAGDAVLQAAAGRFRSVVRIEDTVARLGGDEFALLQVNADDLPASARRLADRLIAVMSKPVDLDGTPVMIGVSIGIALVPETGLDADALQRAADHALYEAKASGRNTYRVFMPAGSGTTS